ncbi:hypothetical protein ACHHYP_00608 [Achlya hypogyna]|uniref:C2 domain-containing protein n=1 Tax=Achlya hypogyna TaxID=1202772 RepID=A0A1V9ZUC4_ACHHY|nr:hypothetical protein ACHHYP_00608 [Achlya hypogyna]
MPGRKVLESEPMDDRLKRQILELRRRQIILEGKLIGAKEAERTDAVSGLPVDADGLSKATLTLEVCTGEGINIDTMARLSTGMTYVQVRLVPDSAQVLSTRLQRWPSLQWQETLTFSGLSSLDAAVYIEVLHAMRLRSDLVLGHVVVPFEHLLAQQTVDEWYTLTSASPHGIGRIHIRTTLTYSKVNATWLDAAA